MNRGAIAEGILSLVMEPQRTVATVGDLLEARLPLRRFWLAVLRTAGICFWRDLFSQPLATGGLAAMGWAAQVISGDFLYSVPFLLLPVRPNWWTALITAILLCSLVPFAVGWGVGKVSRGREVATSLVVAVALPYAVPSYPQVSRLGEFSVLVTFTLMGAVLCRFSDRADRPPSRATQ